MAAWVLADGVTSIPNTKSPLSIAKQAPRFKAATYTIPFDCSVSYCAKPGGDWKDLASLGQAGGVVKVPACHEWQLYISDQDPRTWGDIGKGLTSLNRPSLHVHPDSEDLLQFLPHLNKVNNVIFCSPELTDADLQALTLCTGLWGLDCSGDELTNDGLKYLKQLTAIKSLDIRGDNLSDESLKHIAALTTLEELHLYGENYTDAGVAALASLTNLEYLNINCANVTDKGLAILRSFPKLRRVTLQGKFTTKALANLQGMNLQWLELTSETLGDDVMKYTRDMASLEILDLSGVNLSATGVAMLKDHRALRKLTLSKSVPLDSLSHLAGLTQLEQLEFSGSFSARFMRSEGEDSTDTRLKYYKPLVNIKRMDLCYTGVSDAGLAHLKGLVAMEELDLSDTEITSEGLLHLKAMTAMLNLDSSDTKITDEGLVALSEMTKMTDLNLSDTAIGDFGLFHLRTCTALENLNLAKTKITDEGLACLSDMTMLQTLDLDGTTITGAGFAHLGALKKLKTISFREAGVTDAGLVGLAGLTGLVELDLLGANVSDEGLKHLHPLTNLIQINLSGTNVTPAGVAALKKALPKASISVEKSDGDEHTINLDDFDMGDLIINVK
jgi:internalin A